MRQGAPDSLVSGPLSVEGLIEALSAGREDVLEWLRRRVAERAGPRFSRWAWDWIGEDFLSDLVLQLTLTVTRPRFHLEGSVAAYVDVSIANLCKTYFKRLARLRRGEPLDTAGAEPRDPRSSSLERVSAALELRRLLAAVGPMCRKLLASKYGLGLSLNEIAAREGIEPKTVQSRLHGCRERAREAHREKSTNISHESNSRSVGAECPPKED